MSEEGDSPSLDTPVAPAVTYRLVIADDIGKADLKFYKKKADANEPEDPSTTVDAATVTADNMAEYVVENAAVVASDETANTDDVAGETAKPGDVVENSGTVTPEQQAQITQATRATLEDLHLMPPGQQSGAGRRRSKRRHPKKGSRKSKKGGRKSKKGGRSRKNGSKHRKHSRAHKKH